MTTRAMVLPVIVGLLVLASSGRAAEPPASAPTLEEVMKNPARKVGFLRKTLTLTDGTERVYQAWVPLAYTADKKWPVILFLHGAGECGTEGEKMLNQGLPKEIKQRGGKFDFIVVIPQCKFFSLDSSPPPPPDGLKPKFKGGWRDTDEAAALGAFRLTLKEYSCDPDRAYLTGLSMGGFGTFAIAMKYPKLFAALVPICGGGDPARAPKIAHLPTWIWHGDADGVVPVENSRQMLEAHKSASAPQVKYTELKDVGHSAWDNAYASDALWQWLGARSRTAAAKNETATTAAKPDAANDSQDRQPKKMSGDMKPMDGQMRPMDGPVRPMEGRMKPLK